MVIRPNSAPLGPHVPGELLVQLQEGVQDVVTLTEDYGMEVEESFRGGGLVRVHLSDGQSVEEALRRVEGDPRIRFAEPNHLYELEGARTPNDLKPELWGLHNTGQGGGVADADIDAPEAWAITTGSRETGPIIAILDSGVDLNHPDLVRNLWTNPGEIPGNGIDDDGNGVVDDVHGFDARHQTGAPQDEHSHGTHVAGTIAAEGNDGKGIVGVNWEARLMPVRIFDKDGKTDAATILRGVTYATRMGARLTSNSWGGGNYNQSIKEAFEASPALHIMASGNSKKNNDAVPHYPSSYDLPNKVVVAATDRKDGLARFSNYGATSVDLAAPGVDIYSTVPGGGYASKSGTSMATPHVTGAAALVATAFPGITNDELKRRLMDSADPLPSLVGKVVSGGRLNAASALETDTVPPARPSDLRVAEAKPGQLTLAWTAVGDDDRTGRAASYELRKSDRPIVDEASFQAAEPLFPGTPAAAGGAEKAAVEVFPQGQEQTLHFALKVRDNVGNRSPMQTVTARVPAATSAFQDDFDAPDTGWKVTGDWGRVPVPGRGQVFTDSPAGNYPPLVDTHLTSPRISLKNLKESTLVFDTAYDLDDGRDAVYVQVSVDGTNWEPLTNFTGRSDWSPRKVDLSRYDGKTVQVRFHLHAGRVANRDGFSVDNLRVVGSRAN